jgi:hypothetical protein
VVPTAEALMWLPQRKLVRYTLAIFSTTAASIFNLLAFLDALASLLVVCTRTHCKIAWKVLTMLFYGSGLVVATGSWFNGTFLNNYCFDFQSTCFDRCI